VCDDALYRFQTLQYLLHLIVYLNHILLGSSENFEASENNGVTSLEFTSWFPKVFEFRQASSSYCTDISWYILPIGIITNIAFALFENPVARPDFLIHILVVWGFCYVSFIGQPSYYDFYQIGLGLFSEILIVLAMTNYFCRLFAVHTFQHWTRFSTVERVIYWGVCYVIPFHFALHLNFFAYIPWLVSTNVLYINIYGATSLPTML